MKFSKMKEGLASIDDFDEENVGFDNGDTFDEEAAFEEALSKSCEGCEDDDNEELPDDYDFDSEFEDDMDFDPDDDPSSETDIFDDDDYFADEEFEESKKTLISALDKLHESKKFGKNRFNKALDLLK